MKVLVTGATGYVGSAVVDALLAAGHAVSGLARSEGSARELADRGVSVVMGDVTDAGSIEGAARDAEAVVHAATTHGPDAEAADRTAVGAILRALEGTGRTFVYTSGAWVMGDTPEGVELADEETPIDPTPMLAWRPPVEREVLGARSRGVRAFVVRPALVYGAGGGVVDELVGWARERGAGRFVAPPGGEPSWTLVHRDDLGDLYALLLASELVGGTLLVAAGDGPHAARDVAAAASRAAGASDRAEPWPLDEAREELGDYADALALDQRLSSERARRTLGWAPSAPTVFDELRDGSYGP
ncbi:NAD-dependent epimerase/dehydratase family protein [Rubrobacter marinus]|uniref:NAD-dependent epimerase/dehydratase family protein n=2 Tax=Rubrobacter marinus TaxID=2653852 RepID=A0A6G8Q379_9ACTN|nr:NAD-dependent epimerase/dehydratase family protein [Rubrobacter marinus]